MSFGTKYALLFTYMFWYVIVRFLDVEHYIAEVL
jgi:hypothetical protein